MNWFKHLTDMHEHPDLAEAEEKEKHIAYKAYFILHELYGKYFNELDDNDYLRINIKNLRRKIGISEKKLMKILTIFEKNLIKLKFDEEIIMIKLPQFIDLSSNWTKRKNNRTKRTYTATTALRIRIEVKKRKEEENNTTLYNHEKAFEFFWNIYPKKVNKKATKDYWLKEVEKGEDIFNMIVESLKYQIKEKYINVKDNMKFCPFPLNWLKNKRYEDISDDILKETNTANPGNGKTPKREKVMLENNVGEKEKTVWLEIKERIKSQINEHSYSTFIEPLELIRIEKNKYILETPEDLKIWVEEHYVKTIEEYYGEMLKKEVAIVLH